jgi:polyhydroxyalkanoate synthase
MQQLLQDVQKGHVSQTDESVFEVGRNVATTEGSGGVRERASSS